MISITKIGVGLIALILVAGFATLSFEQYLQTKVISNLTQPVVIKTVVVTPTVAPTATPSAVVKPVTRIGTPISVTKPLTK